jgi:hypothetical protein
VKHLEINGELALAMIGGALLASMMLESILPLIAVGAAVGASIYIVHNIRLK